MSPHIIFLLQRTVSFAINKLFFILCLLFLFAFFTCSHFSMTPFTETLSPLDFVLITVISCGSGFLNLSKVSTGMWASRVSNTQIRYSIQLLSLVSISDLLLMLTHMLVSGCFSNVRQILEQIGLHITNRFFLPCLLFSQALLKALAIGTRIACLTINSSKQKNKKQKTQQHSETSAIQNSFPTIQYFKESSSIFDFQS